MLTVLVRTAAAATHTSRWDGREGASRGSVQRSQHGAAASNELGPDLGQVSVRPVQDEQRRAKIELAVLRALLSLSALPRSWTARWFAELAIATVARAALQWRIPSDSS